MFVEKLVDHTRKEGKCLILLLYKSIPRTKTPLFRGVFLGLSKSDFNALSTVRAYEQSEDRISCVLSREGLVEAILLF